MGDAEMENQSSLSIAPQSEDVERTTLAPTETSEKQSMEALNDHLHAAVCMVPTELISSVDHTLEFLASSVDILDAPPFNFDDLT
jgi:hypothetical protein